MSYVVKHLPNIEILKEQLKENPNMIVYYAKYGGYTGSSESMDYLQKKIKKHYDNKKNRNNTRY